MPQATDNTTSEDGISTGTTDDDAFRTPGHAGSAGYTRQSSVPPPVHSQRLSHVSISSLTELDGDTDQKDVRFRALPRDKKFIVITFSLVNFCLGAFYSLLGPFFPNEAAAKGVSSTTTGLIFGVFELILIIMSPVFGNFLTQIGAKFMYCSGVMVCGSSAILFGFLDGSPDGTIYIVMCFLVRSVEGMSGAAFVTASFAIMAHTFPNNVATMFGTLELFSGLGMMAGPPIGGALYQLGGFRLPFVSSGGLMLLVGLLSTFLLPSVRDVHASSGRFILGLLRIPVLCIMGLCLVAGAAAIGFLDVGMSVYLASVFHFSPVIMGLVFLVAPGIYAITAPLWGYLADKQKTLSQYILICGYTLAGFSFFFLGPAPFLPIANDHLWVLLVSLAVAGLGIGTLVIVFQILTDGTRDYGYSDSLETYGLISGLFNSFFSMGAFIGPLLGGYLIDKLEFPMAAVCMGSMSIGAAMIFLMYTLGVCFCCKLVETEKLPPTSVVTDQSETRSLLSQHSTSNRDSQSECSHDEHHTTYQTIGT